MLPSSIQRPCTSTGAVQRGDGGQQTQPRIRGFLRQRHMGHRGWGFLGPLQTGPPPPGYPTWTCRAAWAGHLGSQAGPAGASKADLPCAAESTPVPPQRRPVPKIQHKARREVGGSEPPVSPRDLPKVAGLGAQQSPQSPPPLPGLPAAGTLPCAPRSVSSPSSTLSETTEMTTPSQRKQSRACQARPEHSEPSGLPVSLILTISADPATEDLCDSAPWSASLSEH